MAVARSTEERSLRACAVGSWTAEDERAHRKMLRTAREYGMFRDDRGDAKKRAVDKDKVTCQRAREMT